MVSLMPSSWVNFSEQIESLSNAVAGPGIGGSPSGFRGTCFDAAFHATEVVDTFGSRRVEQSSKHCAYYVVARARRVPVVHQYLSARVDC